MKSRMRRLLFLVLGGLLATAAFAEDSEDLDTEPDAGEEELDEEALEAELLREIAEEEAREEAERLAEEERIRVEEEALLGKIEQNVHAGFQAAEGAEGEAGGRKKGSENTELSAFQETMITTGSEISKALLIILGIMFVVRAIQVSYKTLSKRAFLKNVAVPQGRAMEAQQFAEMRLQSEADQDISYTTYKSEWKEKRQFYQLLAEVQNKPFQEQKKLLERAFMFRVIAFVKRKQKMSQDEQGLRRAKAMDMCPPAIWDDWEVALGELKEEERAIFGDACKFVQPREKGGFSTRWGGILGDNIKPNRPGANDPRNVFNYGAALANAQTHQQTRMAAMRKRQNPKFQKQAGSAREA